jgi:hypothetical protein
MAEYGDIFDYQLSAMVFEALTMGFIAAYGLAIVFIVAYTESSDLGALKKVPTTTDQFEDHPSSKRRNQRARRCD